MHSANPTTEATGRPNPDADMPRALDPTHRWGERPIFEPTAPGSSRFRERRIPCCLACLVDGYEDEAAAFEPCRRQGSPITTTHEDGDTP